MVCLLQTEQCSHPHRIYHHPRRITAWTKLQEITSSELLFPLFFSSANTASDPHEKIQKVINVMALKLRRENNRGCHYIEAINDFMATGAN